MDKPKMVTFESSGNTVEIFESGASPSNWPIGASG